MNHLIDKIEQYLKKRFWNEASGHDYWHIKRVEGISLYLQKMIGGDVIRIQLLAMLHDVADEKLIPIEMEEEEYFYLEMNKIGIPETLSDQLWRDLTDLSFRTGKVPKSHEARIVQDADRIDAIGAIGVARTFAYGAKIDQVISDPSKQEQKTSIGHFLDKLLLLKDKMNFDESKVLAQKKHECLVRFLQEYEEEESFALGFNVSR